MYRIWIIALIIVTVLCEEKVPSSMAPTVSTPYPENVTLDFMVPETSVHGLEQLVHSLTPNKKSEFGPEYLICFLRKDPPKECNNFTIDISQIPPRLKQIDQKMGEDLKEYIVKGSLNNAPMEIFSKINPIIFFLMPNGDKRLSVGGKALARTVRVQGGEAASVIVSAALLNNSQERDIFVHELEGVTISQRSQSILGEYLSEWFSEGDAHWKSERFRKVLRAGNPLVGSLPPPFLTSLPKLAIERFVFLLSQWDSSGSNKNDQWYSKGKRVTRTWSHLIIKAEMPHLLPKWTTISYKRYTMLLLGFTPDELSTMAVPHRDVRASIFQLMLDKLQARTIFDIIRTKGDDIRASDMKNGIPMFAVPVLTLLSPYQLALYFNHSIADFGVLNFMSMNALRVPSLVTAKQLAHCLIAQKMLVRLASSVVQDSEDSESGSLTKVPTANKTLSHPHINLTEDDFINAGHFVYSLQLSYFRNISISNLSPRHLAMLDSNNLSTRQGRLLAQHLHLHIGRDESTSHTKDAHHLINIDELISFGPGILRGLTSTSFITTLNMRRLPQKVIQHLLLSDRPWTNGFNLEENQSLRSLAILQKVRNEIGQDWVLKYVLHNEASVKLLKYLTPQEVIGISESIIRTASYSTLSGLHLKTLSVLLDAAIPELKLRGPGNGKWTFDGLTSEAAPLLRGLTCSHLDQVDVHDIVVLLNQFNKQRKARSGVKYQPFPKHLQHCSIKALAFHLKAKSALWDQKFSKNNFTSYEQLHVLEASDIESVGGYVIAGLPESVLIFLGADALRLIGDLSSQELISAVFGKHHPSDLALLLSSQLGLDTDLEIHNTSNTDLGQKYKLGRLGGKWQEWSDKEHSLVPYLFGSLLPYLPPELVDSNSLRWFLETASPGDNLVCLESTQRENWYKVLQKAFGDPDTWTPSTLAIIGDFLLVVPPEMLIKIPIKSWTNAADSLIEKTRYFDKSVDMPRGMENYVEACTKFLSKVEQGSYIGAVRELSWYYLVAAQLQLNEVTSYVNIVTTNIKSANDKKRFSQGNLVPVPGLRRPNLNSPNSTEIISVDKTVVIQKEREHHLEDTKWDIVEQITCEAVRAVGPGIARYSLQPKNIESMSPQQVWDCADILGSIPLDEDIHVAVWMKLKNHTGEILHLDYVSKVVGAMSMEELSNFNVSITNDLDAVFVLGREISDWKNANQWATMVIGQHHDKPFSAETVAALGGLLCGIPKATANETLMPNTVFSVISFLASALSVTPTRGCPPLTCLQTLGELAADGLGNPSEGWSAMEMADMGVLAAGFPKEIWRSLDKIEGLSSIMSGLHVSALECMPEDVLKVLSISQISNLSPLVAASLENHKIDLLTQEQKSALTDLLRTPFDDMVFPESYRKSEGHNENEKDSPKDVYIAARAPTHNNFLTMQVFSILIMISLR